LADDISWGRTHSSPLSPISIEESQSQTFLTDQSFAPLLPPPPFFTSDPTAEPPSSSPTRDPGIGVELDRFALTPIGLPNTSKVPSPTTLFAFGGGGCWPEPVSPCGCFFTASDLLLLLFSPEPTPPDVVGRAANKFFRLLRIRGSEF
jgi:hypothetical protein